MSLLLGSFGRASGPPSALGIILIVAISVVGLAVILLGLRTASVARQRFGDELRERQAELSVEFGDPRVPPSDQGEPPAG